ncbi:hypothetical protein J3A83DRAFT_3479335 [Scleroderma citrinum]
MVLSWLTSLYLDHIITMLSLINKRYFPTLSLSPTVLLSARTQHFGSFLDPRNLAVTWLSLRTLTASAFFLFLSGLTLPPRVLVSQLVFFSSEGTLYLHFVRILIPLPSSEITCCTVTSRLVGLDLMKPTLCMYGVALSHLRNYYLVTMYNFFHRAFIANQLSVTGRVCEAETAPIAQV